MPNRLLLFGELRNCGSRALSQILVFSARLANGVGSNGCELCVLMRINSYLDLLLKVRFHVQVVLLYMEIVCDTFLRNMAVGAAGVHLEMSGLGARSVCPGRWKTRRRINHCLTCRTAGAI